MTITHTTPPPPDVLGNISIIHKTYKFYLFLYSLTKSFPKKDRYTLGIKCENIVLEILELLFLANSKTKSSRLLILNKADVKLKVLKTLIRICFDIKAIDQKKYILLQGQLQEIGRMIGGWIKQTKNSPNK